MNSEAKQIIEEGIPLDHNPKGYDQGGRPANAYVYREGMNRLVIYPKDAYSGALFIDMEHIGGDIAPGH